MLRDEPLRYAPSEIAVLPDGRLLMVAPDTAAVIVEEARSGNAPLYTLTTYMVPGDLEGVTTIPGDSSIVYIGVEWTAGGPAVVEYDLVSGELGQVFRIPPPLGSSPSKGLEGVVFIPDPDDSQGGLFWIGFQHDAQVYVYRLNVNRDPSAPDVEFVRRFAPAPGFRSVQSLSYWTKRDSVLGVFEEWLIEFAINRTATSLTPTRQWRIPFANAEGAAVRSSDNRLFIACDACREVYSFDFTDTDTPAFLQGKCDNSYSQSKEAASA